MAVVLWPNWVDSIVSSVTYLLLWDLVQKRFLFIIYGYLAVPNLQNVPIFCRILRSKFGLNLKSVIYGSVKFHGIGPLNILKVNKTHSKRPRQRLP